MPKNFLVKPREPLLKFRLKSVNTVDTQTTRSETTCLSLKQVTTTVGKKRLVMASHHWYKPVGINAVSSTVTTVATVTTKLVKWDVSWVI